MAATAKRTDPALWDRVKAEVTAGDKGGRPGEWSARKAQMATHRYKAEGGGYEGPKAADNHLTQWTEEHWGTKSGHDSRETGERYLPQAALDKLTPAEYRKTSAKKRADTAKGKQHSAQPAEIAHKATAAQLEKLTRAELLTRAQHIPGRSRMRKADLVHALTGA